VDKKIRVAMLGVYPGDSSQITGGVQAAYAYLVRGLRGLSLVEMNILSIKPSSSFLPSQVVDRNLTLDFLPVYPRYERLRNYRTYQSIVNRCLEKIRPDLVHAQDAGSDALVAIRSGYPTVVTVHGIRWEDGKHYSSWGGRLRNLFDSLVTERYVMRHVRHLIAISPYVTDYYKKIMRPDVAVYSVPNAVDERFFNLVKRSNAPVVLFAGRVIPRKGVLDLVRSFAQVVRQFPAACLHIAGEITSEVSDVETIRRWVHQAGLDENICFLGPLSEEQIFKEFAGCRLLALASAQETAPMVIAQAMAAGTPVVATRVGGVGAMVAEDRSRGFLVNVGDVDGLADAMICLLRNPGLQAEMGGNGRKFARENYHPMNVASRTYEVYKKIVCMD
jgi:glycosyltransferase involved in cell wall biosynthesis